MISRTGLLVRFPFETSTIIMLLTLGYRDTSAMPPGWIPCLVWKLLRVLVVRCLKVDRLCVSWFLGKHGIYIFPFSSLPACTVIISFTFLTLKGNPGRMSKLSRLTFQTRKQECSKPSWVESRLSWTTRPRATQSGWI